MKPSFRKTLLGVLAAALLAVLMAGSFYLKSLAEYRQAVRQISIRQPPLSQLADGLYTGQWDVSFISAKVEVRMEGGKMKEIRILQHKNGRGQPAEAVIDRMLAEQSLEVDAVSGATNSSKVLQKAVEQALTPKSE